MRRDFALKPHFMGKTARSPRRFGAITSAAGALESALRFTVTLNGGTASGSAFKEGESVTVTANAPADGQQFKEWTGADGLTVTSGGKSASASITCE